MRKFLRGNQVRRQLVRGRRRQSQLLVQRLELIFLKKGAEYFLVAAPGLERRGVQAQLEVVFERHQLTRKLRRRAALLQSGSSSRRLELVDVGENVLERAVPLEQRPGRLRAYARDARHVVHAVALERQKVRHRRGRYAHLRGYRVLVHLFYVGDAGLGREHLYAPAHERHQILIAGKYEDLVESARAPPGERRDDVVRLHPLLLDHGEAQQAGELLDGLELGDEVFGRRLARGLVLGIYFLAEGGPAALERDGDVRWLIVGDGLQEHPREAEDGGGVPTVGGA